MPVPLFIYLHRCLLVVDSIEFFSNPIELQIKKKKKENPEPPQSPTPERDQPQLLTYANIIKAKHCRCFIAPQRTSKAGACKKQIKKLRKEMKEVDQQK